LVLTIECSYVLEGRSGLRILVGSEDILYTAKSVNRLRDPSISTDIHSQG